jgi:hypothetical protein
MPLTVWFTACWLFATLKDGISALALQRALGIGSYQTAWAMLHRLRPVLVRPGRELLQGRVEVDETYIGGIEPGLAGGRAKGKKALVSIAVERVEPRGFGRCRMAWLLDGSSNSLREVLADHVEQGATVITDGWAPYRPATKDLYVRERVVQPGTKGDCQRICVWHDRKEASCLRVTPQSLPRRVRVPLQPPPLTQPRDGLLPWCSSSPPATTRSATAN